MIDLEVLKSKGVHVDELKKKFSLPKDKRSKELNAWIERASSRLQDGINWNMQNYKVYHALDTAWDTPFRQVSPTLLASMIGKDYSDKNVLSLIDDWGLRNLVETRTVKDPKTGKDVNIIDAPAFFNVFVPLVRAYVTIRWAKIMNDRALTPFLKFEPSEDTYENRLKCEVITDRIQKISNQFGYFNVIKQAVFQMLHYSVCLQFPEEEWYDEWQLEKDDKGNVKKKLEKEGIRYHMPHPCRMFNDQSHRVSTFNTDTGCEYAGYWRVKKYKDVKNNKALWNTDKISIGATDWTHTHSNFFNTIYKCTLAFPQNFTPTGNTGGEFDREAILAGRIYSSALDDAAVMQSEYFEKLIPSEHGFGDYDHPVWFRFIFASDDTVMYAAPLPYCPVIYYGYDAHEGRAQNASLSLEILPFQDQVSNLLSQVILSVKQNLTNVTFVDTDQVEEEDIKKLQGFGEKFYRAMNFIRYSSRKWRQNQNQLEKAFQSVRFGKLDTSEVINAIKVVLDILERVLVMSSQEVAQAASHEQTREEVRNISQSTSSRLTFTTMPVDDAREAMKRQLYRGLMAYGEAEAYEAQVSGDFASVLTKEELEKLGFTMEKPKKQGDKAKVKASKEKSKTAIALDSFASSRDGNDRIDNVAAATAMSNFLVGVLNNPMLAPAIGTQQSIALMNLIGRMAGFPRDFVLKDFSAENMPTQEQQMQQQAAQAEQIMAGVQQQLQQNNVMLGQEMQKNNQQMAQQMSQEQQAAQAQLMEMIQQVIAKSQEESTGQIMQQVSDAIMPIADMLKQTAGKVEEQGSAIEQLAQVIETLQVPQPPPVNPELNELPPNPPPAI